MDYSPHREAGGTLHLPSPTFAHHIDALSTTDFRRSMSRSPSKPQKHLYAQTPTRSNLSPLSAQGAFSPQLPAQPKSLFSLSPNTTNSTPPPPRKRFPVSFKRSHRSTRHSGFARSPMRRALGESSHHGNVTPTLSRSSSGEENNPGSASTNNSTSQPGSDEKPPLFRFDTHSASAPVKFDPLRPRSRTVVAMPDNTSNRSGPLKRGDGAMDLEQATLSTPVKRRSVHGGFFGGDFDVFNQSSPLNLDTPVITTTEPERQRPSLSDRHSHLFGSNDLPSTSFSSPTVKRASTLRKSQRHGQALTRGRGFHDSSNDGISQSSPAYKRQSMDASLLLSLSSLSAQSANTATNQVFQQSQAMRSANSVQDHQPHPLSRSFVASSSSSCLPSASSLASADSDSTNQLQSMPKPPLPQPRNPLFSKSLPVGALRPSVNNSSASFTTDSFATPASFKPGKHPGGYMSTGLISKRNRNPDYHPYNDTDRYAMPDTPSKRASFPPVTTTPFGKSQTSVFANFQDLGTPLPNTSGRSSITNLFRRSSKNRPLGHAELVRRSSFVSEDGDNPIEKQDSHSSADELPPTPTKANANVGRSKPTSLRSSIFGRRTSLGPDTFLPIVQTTPAELEIEIPRLVRKGKHSRITIVQRSNVEGLHVNLGHSALSHDVLVFDQPHCQLERSLSDSAVLTEPTEWLLGSTGPDSHASSSANSRLSNHCLARSITKHKGSRVVTPIHNQSAHTSPQTPQEAFTPPDSNFLSLATFKNSTNSNIIPATPTAQKDHPFGMPAAGVTQNDVDTSITSRFGTVITIAQGEFSIVYKAEKPYNESFSQGQSSSSPGKAWVVKKSKRAYIGAKDRQHKIREVEILRVLRGREHILEFFDCWETQGHLYIQTEYCDNGSLSKFLAETGNKARLDDFRIWKILLELSIGVKAIHDSGFIHLDLKPANIFITWDGSLKIGDFGLASSWPAPKDIEGEGDREYISPEALHGRFDKPADVFAVGLITLEIAGNFFLPDNGDQWQRLRSGNLSDIPNLTWSVDSQLERNENGDPFEDESPTRSSSSGSLHYQHVGRHHPPAFMLDYNDVNSLDHMVEWMICPNPDERPTMQQVFDTEPLRWIAKQRRAGATVYEGNWGPADDVWDARVELVHPDTAAAMDVEMSDV